LVSYCKTILLAQEKVSQVYAQQLLEDEKAVEITDSQSTLSLAGKYMPREKKASFEKSWGAAKQIRTALKAQSQQTWDNKRYRQLKTKLGAALDVCEVKMCANTRCEITIQKMPSRALMRYKRCVLSSTGCILLQRILHGSKATGLTRPMTVQGPPQCQEEHTPGSRGVRGAL
tara:strand:+ start:535 stop:1053 length:519 start_codon:yes stop_codon:yes gene_type:complete